MSPSLQVLIDARPVGCPSQQGQFSHFHMFRITCFRFAFCILSCAFGPPPGVCMCFYLCFASSFATCFVETMTRSLPSFLQSPFAFVLYNLTHRNICYSSIFICQHTPLRSSLLFFYSLSLCCKCAVFLETTCICTRPPLSLFFQ